MSRLDLILDSGRTVFEPGGIARGTVVWRLPEPPERLEIHLLWYTTGKGRQDLEIVRTVELPATGSGEESFEIPLPAGPYSFVGELIVLHWALEAVAEPGLGSTRTEITLAPGGEAIRLEPLPEKEPAFGRRRGRTA